MFDAQRHIFASLSGNTRNRCSTTPSAASGHAVDVVLAVMLGELMWLTARARWTPVAAFLRLGPGALMMLALRSALTGADWPWIALPPMPSFPVHLADLGRRTDR